MPSIDLGSTQTTFYVVVVQSLTLEAALEKVKYVHFDEVKMLTLEGNKVTMLIKGEPTSLSISLKSNDDLKILFEAFNSAKRSDGKGLNNQI